jgi:hypothetical protein
LFSAAFWAKIAQNAAGKIATRMERMRRMKNGFSPFRSLSSVPSVLLLPVTGKAVPTGRDCPKRKNPKRTLSKIRRRPQLSDEKKRLPGRFFYCHHVMYVKDLQRNC